MREKLRHVLQFIEQHLGQPLTSEELAKEACLSVSRFHRVFKEETGSSPRKFIENMRLAKAHEQLAQGGGSVQELAIELGYNDYETFSRAFKRKYHFSPDDLKAIAIKTKSVLEGESKLFVISAEELDAESFKQKVIERLEEEGIDVNDIEHSAALMIQHLDLNPNPENGAELIKNKYVISSGASFWEEMVADLLKKSKS